MGKRPTRSESEGERGGEFARALAGGSRCSPFFATLRTFPPKTLSRFLRRIYILGISPDPFTLRELVWMVEGRGKFEWNQTSSLMALAVNLMRDPRKSKAARPSDFNPFAPSEPVPVLKGKEMLAALKAAFIKPDRAKSSARGDGA